MKTIVPPHFHQVRSLGFGFILLLLCSCATTPEPSASIPASALPADVAMNQDASHGQKLWLTLHLENGKELLFVVDTGCSGTILDSSLKPMLGKYLRSGGINYAWYGRAATESFEAPKLYLGNTLLLDGDEIYTDSLRRICDCPVAGILGMNCLRHYCIQLDFARNRIRFLDPERAQGEKSGKKFPLVFLNGTPSIHANFFGQRSVYGVDTGCDTDAAFKPKLFQRKVRELSAKLASDNWWLTKTATNFAETTTRQVLFPEVEFNDLTCTNFILQDCPVQNLIGLRFLARHLVTLNFPKNTMYLQRRSDEPFADEDIMTMGWGDAHFLVEVEKILSDLKEKGALPGWSKSEHGQLTWDQHEKAAEVYPILRTLMATKENDVSKYHYTVTRASKDSTWKLEKAWRTDAKGNVVEEWPVK